MIISFVLIHKVDLLSVKIEIYYQIIKIITKNICNYKLINLNNKIRFFCLTLESLS